MSNRLNQERESELQPKRIEFAINELNKLGYTPTYVDKTKIEFKYKNSIITLFPYSGWFQGKGVKAGRGIQKLINQL